MKQDTGLPHHVPRPRNPIIALGPSWRELLDLVELDNWRGLVGRIPQGTVAGFTVTTTAPRSVQVAMGGRTLIQSEIDEGWYGYDLARATGDESLHVVPPIPFDVVEREAHRRGVPRSYGRFWSRRFAADLWQAPARSPLHEGRWHLGPAPPRFSCSVLDPATVHSVVTQAASGEVDWGRPVYPITLRNMSAPDDGRVKAWRKLARRGQLPPVLLWWVSGLQAYVVLDGHDRLNAASCEGVGVDTIGLHRVELASAPQHEREETMEALSAWEATRQQGANRSETDAINRLILRLYQERLHERPTKATYLDDVVLGIEPDAGD